MKQKIKEAASTKAAGKPLAQKAKGITPTGSPKAAAGGSATFYSASEARKHWSKITKQALDGEKVAIIVGKRALVLKEVSLTYAESEYGVNPAQIDAKAKEIETRAAREIASGAARRIV